MALPRVGCALTFTGTSRNLEPFHAVLESARHSDADPTKGLLGAGIGGGIYPASRTPQVTDRQRRLDILTCVRGPNRDA